MADQLQLLRKAPCNGCRQRKRKCSYDQPCARCFKAGIECVYTVMPSPKDLEYVQELEYINQMNELEHQIAAMENEMAVLKLTKENEARRLQHLQQEQPQQDINSSSALHYDYPSPVSVHELVDNQKEQTQKLLNNLKHFKPAGPVEIGPITASKYLDFDPPVSTSTKHHQQSTTKHAHTKGRRKKQKTLIKAGDLKANISKEEPNDEGNIQWTLTVKKGKFSINTSIKSFTDFMNNLSKMIPAAVSQSSSSSASSHSTGYDPRQFPFNLMPLQSKDAMGTVIGVLVWRKYSKSRLKSINKIVPTTMYKYDAQQQQELTVRMSSIDQLTTITMRLLSTYFQCAHLLHFSIYIPEFVRLYMQPDTLLSSSAVMALCSAICYMHCKHLSQIVPADALPAYGIYYFEQARLLVEDRFDEISLENMLTYKYMALHKLKIKDVKEADRYLCLAERLYNMLLPQYEYKREKGSDTPQSSISMLFHRAYRGIRHARLSLEVHYIMTNMWAPERRVPPHHLFSILNERMHEIIEVYPGDSEREKSFADMRYYLSTLKSTINQAAQFSAASDYPTYIGVMGHQIEMGMRHCYRSLFPAEFQLSLPLFEDTLSDLEFFKALENDYINNHNYSPIPILTTISIYHEYLIMAKSYMPKYPMDANVDTDELIRRFKEKQYETEHHHFFGKHDHQDHFHRSGPELPNDPFQNHPGGHRPGPKDRFDKRFMMEGGRDHPQHHTVDNWMRLIYRMRNMKREHKDQFTEEELQETDEVYISKFIKALNPSKLNFDLPIVNTSIRAALNVVRLVQFLLSKPEAACFVDVGWIYSAWEILLRAARFRYQQHFNDSNNAITLDRVRANLLLCLTITKNHLALGRLDSNDPFITVMEERFNSLF